MTLLVIIASIVNAPQEERLPFEQPPPVALAVSLAEAVGPTVDTLAIDADATVTPQEREQLAAAVANTGLFTLVDPEQSGAILQVRRVDETSVIATAVRPDGTRIWVGGVIWPVAERQARAAPADPEELYRRVLTYERQKLQVVPVSRDHVPPPLVVGALDPRWWREPGPLPYGYPGLGGVPATAPRDWVIVRGAADVMTEQELARLLGDTALEERIEDARFWPRLWWALGFGAGAVAGLGGGAYLATQDDRDERAVGYSLITVGAVSGVMALLFPLVDVRHTLSATEAQRYVDDYNEGLRRKLELTPDDIARYGRQR